MYVLELLMISRFFIRLGIDIGFRGLVYAGIGGLFALSTGAHLAAAQQGADNGAVVIMYHRFGEAKYPSTNTTIEQLEAHIGELASGGYHILPVPDIVKALRDGVTLPERTVGITIDDAYLSVYTEAWPRLKTAGLPFTVFVATGLVDQNVSGYMTWEQIRELANSGVSIGGHTVSHLHMPGRALEISRGELGRSNNRLVEKLGKRPTIFAYPYGESSLAVQGLVRDFDYGAAFGQHSGAIAQHDNLFNLPRFALNENYGGLSRLRLAANSRPLPITDITPVETLITNENPPAMGFTLTRKLKGIGRLACYSSHAGKARLEWLGDRRVEVRVDKAFPKGRTRVNCTLPAKGKRWFWFGRQFYRPN